MKQTGAFATPESKPISPEKSRKALNMSTMKLANRKGDKGKDSASSEYLLAHHFLNVNSVYSIFSKLFFNFLQPVYNIYVIANVRYKFYN
jgi:hypothetical protein